MCAARNDCGAQAVQRRLRGDEHDVALAARDAVERREALGDEVLVRREVVVGQRLPVGEDARCASVGREPRDLVGEARARRARRRKRRRACDAVRGAASPSCASASASADPASGRQHEAPACVGQDRRKRRQRRKRICERLSDRRRVRGLPEEALRRPSQHRSRPSACEKRECRDYTGRGHCANESDAMCFIRLPTSTGLTKCASNPASWERWRSCSCPKPVSATIAMRFPGSRSRMRRQAS